MQAEFANVDGGDTSLHHGIDEERIGLLYVPQNCYAADSNCKFMIVSHGAGGSATAFAKTWGPVGSAYDIIMYFG